MPRGFGFLSFVLTVSLAIAATLPSQSPGYRWVPRERHPSLTELIVHDVVRDVTVMLEPHSSSQGVTYATWEWLGNRWVERTDAVLPQAFRNSATWSFFVQRPVAVTFDPSTNKVLLLGVDLQSVVRTYLYDGNAWTLAASGGPGARLETAAAADFANGRVVLFGGRSLPFGGASLSDTWTWDGVGWSLLSGAGGPGQRSLCRLAFNPATARVALFGGFDGTGAFGGIDQVYELAGSSWQSLPSSPPVNGQPRALASAPGGIGCHVLLPPQGLAPTSLQLWDGAGWTAAPATGVGDHGRIAAQAPDRLLWLDGPASWQLRTRTLTPSTGQWQTLQANGAPLGYGWSFTAVEPQDALVFRTTNSFSFPSEFWRLDHGGTFTHLATAPHDTNNPNLMAYHPPSGYVVLVNPYTGNTNSFTGVGVIPGGTLPDAGGIRYLAGYHPPTGRLLALARSATGQLEIWGFAPSAWTLLATGPAMSSQPVGAYDGARDRLVFADRYGATVGEWDGATFTSIPAPPGTTDGITMTPHPDGGVAWLQSTPGASYAWTAVHRWDGTSWSTAPILNPIAGAFGVNAPVHYDIARRRWTMFFLRTYDLESAAFGVDAVVPSPGATLTYSFERAASANRIWAVALSTDTAPAIPWRASPTYGTEVIPLANDWLLGASLGLGMFGVLDAQGMGQVQLTLPNVPLPGFRAYAAAVTLGTSQPFEFVSAPVPFTLRN